MKKLINLFNNCIKHYKFKNVYKLDLFLCKYIENNFENLFNISCYNTTDSTEELDLINGNRPSEIHSIIFWNGNKYYDIAQKYVKQHLPKYMKIVYDKKIILSKNDNYKLTRSIYSEKAVSRVINNCIYLIIIKDESPIYSYEKASVYQVLNKKYENIKRKYCVLNLVNQLTILKQFMVHIILKKRYLF